MLLGVCAYICSTSLTAQTLDAGLKGGVYGQAVESARRDRLDVVASLLEGRDSELPPELRSGISERSPQAGGYSSILMASGNFQHTRRPGKFVANALTSLRYYPRLGKLSAAGNTAAIGATINLPKRSSLELNQEAAYAPSYFYQLFPTVTPSGLGDPAVFAPDYRVDDSQSERYTSRVMLTAGSARATQVVITAEHNTTNFHGDIARPGLDITTGRARWAHGMGRTGAVSVGYEHRQGEFGYGGRSVEHRLRIGADYSPALSVTRRAHYRFSLTPATLEIPASSTRTLATGTVYKLEGDASADYPFLRSWSLGGSYRRGVEYIAALRDPVFKDSGRLELKGLLTRTLDLSVSGALAVGRSVLARENRDFDTYTGDVRARYAVSHSVALVFEYLYYYYNFHGQTALAPDLPSEFVQHGVRVGLMLWARPVSR